MSKGVLSHSSPYTGSTLGLFGRRCRYRKFVFTNDLNESIFLLGFETDQ